ncbi:MAG: hypothetical protein IPF83_12970 [Rhodanobacteraceae bacterium]|nr:hypothetical protein [Rhodanobacteraceae bacterium]MBP9154948.1 hypothetical protein [Xanthomonadales bacterium]
MRLSTNESESGRRAPRPAAPSQLFSALLVMLLVVANAGAASTIVAVDASADDDRSFEREPEYRADQLLQPALLSGPSWQIDPAVPMRGYLAQFRLATDYGDLQVEGRAELVERIHEIEVVEQLATISRTTAFATAIGHASKDIAKTMARIGAHPIQTVKSIPGGLIRSLHSKWRDLREQTAKARDRASEEWHEDDNATGIGPQSPTPHVHQSDWWLQSQRTTGKFAKRWIGFTAARREVAQRMGVDPYSRNALLNREMDRIAWASLVGDKSLSAAIDSMAPGASEAIGVSRKVDDVVWRLDPVALGLLQRERMTAVCGEQPMIAKAMHQGALSPTQWQHLVEATEALHIKHCEGLLNLVAQTDTDAEARYLVRTLELLEMHRTAEATVELDEAGRMLIAHIDGVLVVPIPVDVLSWTMPIANLFDDPALRAAKREIWLDGEATMRTQRELTRRGFGLRLDLPRGTRAALPLPEEFAPG